MGWFTERHFKPYKYLEPERLAPVEIRRRRLESLVERETRFNDVANFKETLERLYQVPKKVDTTTPKAVNDRFAIGQKAISTFAALHKYKSYDFADPLKAAAYKRTKIAHAIALEQLAKRGGQQKVKASGSDKRFYNPTGKSFASTKYGTVARQKMGPGWIQVFAVPSAVIPCVQRKIRRQVMFAMNKAGRGYHTRHRRTWASGIPC